MMTNTNRTLYQVTGITKHGGSEYQCCERKLEDAQRIGRIIADGYASVEIKEIQE